MSLRYECLLCPYGMLIRFIRLLEAKLGSPSKNLKAYRFIIGRISLGHCFEAQNR